MDAAGVREASAAAPGTTGRSVEQRFAETFFHLVDLLPRDAIRHAHCFGSRSDGAVVANGGQEFHPPARGRNFSVDFKPDIELWFHGGLDGLSGPQATGGRHRAERRMSLRGEFHLQRHGHLLLTRRDRSLEGTRLIGREVTVDRHRIHIREGLTDGNGITECGS